MLKLSTLKLSVGTALLAMSLGCALPAFAQDSKEAPAATEEAAPAADDSAAAPATEPAQPADSAAPAAESTEAAPSGESAGTASESPTAAPSTAPKASDLALNAPVIGSDGKEIGTISRISSTADGSVDQIHVNTGSATVVVPGSAIAEAGSSVKLSLTSEEVSKLPAAGDDNG